MAFRIVGRVTVREAIQSGAHFLEGKGVDSPRLNAEWVLAKALALPRLELFLNAGRILSRAEIEDFQIMTERRGRREPLQHILGTASFCGLELWVTPDVLVPRPETELLAERAVNYLRERDGCSPGEKVEGRPDKATQMTVVSNPEQAGSVAALDIGTGSGCLSIFIAHHFRSARVTSVDISPAALHVARENARLNGVSDRIEFLEGDCFAPLEAGRQFDLIVSNPPYIPHAEIAGLEPEVREHDPRRALDGGIDGLDFYRRFAHEAIQWLSRAGRLMVELGHDQAALVREIFERQMWIVEAVEPDYSRIPRILIARRD